jgi:hypothetical protein
MTKADGAHVFWLKIFECAWKHRFRLWKTTLGHSDPQQNIISEHFFFIFFTFCRIAKWYSRRISARVVQFLLRSSFCKLFLKSFGILRIKIMGSLGDWFSGFNWFFSQFIFPIQLAHRYHGFETHWLSGLFLLAWIYFIWFIFMWSCQSLIVSCPMVTVFSGQYLFVIRMNVQ